MDRDEHPILDYFLTKVELDHTCSEMQKDQTIFWKNKKLEDYMMPEGMKEGESCQEYIDRIQKENPKLMVAVLQSSYLMVYKQMPTKEQLFDVWFQENCQSDELQTEYGNHKLELQQMGEPSPDFRKWSSEKFFQLLETNQIDPEVIDTESFLGQGRR